MSAKATSKASLKNKPKGQCLLSGLWKKRAPSPRIQQQASGSFVGYNIQKEVTTNEQVGLLSVT
jgi:hypothetical protein